MQWQRELRLMDHWQMEMTEELAEIVKDNGETVDEEMYPGDVGSLFTRT